MGATATRTAFRTCPLCEAGCGLEITARTATTRVTRIRGDRDDVFSHGFICPKGSTLKQLHEDPDRLRHAAGQARRRASSRSTWDEAFAEVERRLLPVIERARPRRRRPSTSATRTPTTSARLLYLRPLLKALGTTNVFSASTVDQRPKEVAAGADVRRRAHRPGARRRPHRLPADARRQPVRVERQPGHRARLARPPRGAARPRRHAGRRRPAPQPRPPRRPTQQIAIRPGHRRLPAGGDGHTCSSTRASSTSARSREYVDGLDEVARRARAVHAPRRSPASTGVDADDDPAARPRARRRADAPPCTAASAPRTAEFGTLARWLVDVLNVAHRQPRPAGRRHVHHGRGRRVEHPRHAAASAGASRLGRRHSRVRGLPETLGELPGRSCLAEEIETPGEGQIRALVTVAGNPVLSTPNGGRLDAALDRLEFMVSVDIYVNETTRHADVILPAPVAAAEGATTTSRCCSSPCATSPTTRAPCSPLDDGQLDEWEILARLALDRPGHGRRRRPGGGRRPDDRRPGRRGRRRRAPAASHGRDPTRSSPRSATARGPERILDLMLRTGPYGDGFGADPDGLTLDELLGQPPRHRPRAARAPAARGAAHADAARSSWRPSRSSPTSPGCGPRSTAPRRRAACSSAAATCARTTRGCTTSRCW